MLNLTNLKPKQKKKNRKRVGRGHGSGKGTYAGRGMKGQKSRSGGNIRPGFEGGRMTLVRQTPKVKGFKSIHGKAAVLNLSDLEANFKAGELISPKVLLKKGLVKSVKNGVKVLGRGEVKKDLTLKNVTVSSTAKAAIEKAGGKVE